MTCCAKSLPHSFLCSRKNVTVTKKLQIKLLKTDTLFSGACGCEQQSSMGHVVYEGAGGQIANTGPSLSPRSQIGSTVLKKRMKQNNCQSLPASPHGSSDKDWLPCDLKSNHKMMFCLPVVINDIYPGSSTHARSFQAGRSCIRSKWNLKTLT